MSVKNATDKHPTIYKRTNTIQIYTIQHNTTTSPHGKAPKSPAPLGPGAIAKIIAIKPMPSVSWALGMVWIRHTRVYMSLLINGADAWILQ